MSLLDINDNINNDDALIRGFIMDNYIIKGEYKIRREDDEYIVDVNDKVIKYVKNKNIASLTNGLFRWV